MGKCLPNFITMDYYNQKYLTKDYVIVDEIEEYHKKDNKKKKDLNNKSMLEYIYNNLKFW
tara:strand:- start:506 stop:685 length:180 start_codon:yes stop_codon:yes gene_type:complete